MSSDRIMHRRAGLAALLIGALAAPAGAEQPHGARTQAAASPLAERLPPASQMFVFWPDDVRPAGFRNMAKLYVAAPVERGPRITPLPVSKLTLKASYREKGRIRTIADYMADNHTAGLLVLHRGRIVLERYGLGLAKDKVWVSNSAAKSFTSTLVGAAIKDGKIGSVDDPITKYVPELRGSAWDDVTIRHALTMSTGIEYKEIYGQGGDGGRITGLAVPDGRPVPEGVDLLTFLAKSKRLAPAGTTFNYASSVSRLLGVIVANATGKPLNEYLSEKVWVPAGMEHDASWIVDGAGRIMSSGFLNATLRDYARFGRFFMLGGKDENGKSVLPDGWVAEATYPAQVADADGTRYGYQWWVYPDGSYRAIGVYGQMIYIDPKRDLIIASVSSWPEAEWEEGYDRQDLMIQGVIKAIGHDRHSASAPLRAKR